MIKKVEELNWQQIIVIFIDIGVVSFIGYLATESIDDQYYTPNCWEDRIEGINTQTGNKAFYSDNFRCEFFQPK